MEKETLLKPGSRKFFKQAWIPALMFYVSVVIIRSAGLLGIDDLSILGLLGFVIMGVVPFLFYNNEGRSMMGIRKIDKLIWIIPLILIGAGMALVIGLIGYVVYGTGERNWFVTLMNTYNFNSQLTQMPRIAFFFIVTIPLMILSPIGEEFFFRGVVHSSIKEKWGITAGMIVNSLAFTAIYVFQHGLHRTLEGITCMPVSGVIWLSLIFTSGIIFTLIRERTDSVWSSVIAHSAYILTMNVFIFTVLK
jgi:uncharacterized protein